MFNIHIWGLSLCSGTATAFEAGHSKFEVGLAPSITSAQRKTVKIDPTCDLTLYLCSVKNVYTYVYIELSLYVQYYIIYLSCPKCLLS